MATDAVNIGAAVGKRNLKVALPNRPQDLAIIADLFDRIPSRSGGTSDVAGQWPADQPGLSAQITAQITTFQSLHRSLTADSAIDPGGSTLRLMNQLAADPPLGATVVNTKDPALENDIVESPYMASIASMPGSKPLEPVQMVAAYSRRLVKVSGSSIKWFGVVLPDKIAASPSSAPPLVFFTPTPIQGGYHDNTYDSFDGWLQLWLDYTSRIGGLLSAAGTSQILVLPFYKTSQSSHLGTFLKNWREVIGAVVTAAVNDINPYALRTNYSFDRLYSASFSNGLLAHFVFNSQGTGVRNMTSLVFDLDGQAMTGGAVWKPTNGVIYANKGAPPGGNPHGTHWYVGGRWSAFDNVQPQTSRFSHHACSQFLLFHGLRQYTQ